MTKQGVEQDLEAIYKLGNSINIYFAIEEIKEKTNEHPKEILARINKKAKETIRDLSVEKVTEMISAIRLNDRSCCYDKLIEKVGEKQC